MIYKKENNIQWLFFNIALSRAGAEADRCAMIGDRLDNDIVPAEKLGMNTVWVRQEFARYQSSVSECERPDFTVDSIGEILNIL